MSAFSTSDEIDPHRREARGASKANVTHWMDIQEKSFTRWCNYHLKERGMFIDSLGQDLKDGLLLINLLELLSGKSLGRYNKHPRIPIQKIENTAQAVSFIQAEGINLVNISGEDLSSGSMKLTLGLIWQLILHYQINMGDDDHGGKNALLEWVRSKIPEYDIKSFKGKDWNDGRALCALVNAIQPDACPEHWDLDPSNKADNCQRGIDMADEFFAIPKLLSGNEMANPKIDEKSMMTYISYFPAAEPQQRTNDAHLYSAIGDGLVEGIVNEESMFQIFGPGTGELKVVVEGPEDEAPVNIAQTPTDDGVIYDVSYTPTTPGEYKVHVTVDDVHIPGSTFLVIVLEETSLGGEGKIRVFYSTTHGTEKTRSDRRNLDKLLEEREIHLRDDFEPWIPVDIMETADRNAVFGKAGTRTLPIVYIDDQYVGGYDRMLELANSGELDNLLRMDKYKASLGR